MLRHRGIAAMLLLWLSNVAARPARPLSSSKGSPTFARGADSLAGSPWGSLLMVTFWAEFIAGGDLRGEDKVFPAVPWAHIIRNAAQLYPGTIPYSSATTRWLQGLLLPPGIPQKSVGRNLTRRRNRALVRYGKPPLCQYCNPIPLIVWKWCSYTQPTYSVRSCAPWSR